VRRENLFPSKEDLRSLSQVVLGTKKPDLVIVGGDVFIPYVKKFVTRDIWIYKNWVAALTSPKPLHYYRGINIIDARGKKVVPGFIDGHIHVESTLLNPIEFARLAAVCGVTTAFTDFHELASVVNVAAFHHFINSIPWKLPCKLFFFFPHNLLNVDRLDSILQYEGLCEYFYQWVLQGLEDLELKMFEIMLNLRKKNKLIEGHLFRVTTELAMSLCRACGIRSDHEVRGVKEIEDKILSGFFVFLRSGTLAKEGCYLLRECVKRGLPLERIGLVTDDILVRDIDPQNYMLKKLYDAVNQGVSLEESVNLVTYNVARHFKIDEFLGTIIPGSFADLLIIDDNFTINEVVSAGHPLKSWDVDSIEWSCPESVLKNVITRGTVTLDRLERLVDNKLPRSNSIKNGFLVKAMFFNEETRFTQLKDVKIIVDDNQYKEIIPDDVCYIFSFDRHDSSRIGFGFIVGYNLIKGAIATSISHDKHHIIVIGKNLYDIAAAVNKLIELNGGIVLSINGKVIEEISLPIGGLMSLEPYEVVKNRTLRLHKRLKDLGVCWNDPIFPVFWLGMEEAPEFRITPDGVINTTNKTIVNVLIEGEQ